MSEILTCPWCNKPRATRADWERYEGGEGTHLCWADPRCEMDGDEEIVVVLRAALAAAERERDEARASEEWLAFARMREERDALKAERNAALTLAENRGAAYDMTWREVESLRDRLDKEEEERGRQFGLRVQAEAEVERLMSLVQAWYEGRARIGAHMTFVDQRFYDGVRCQRTGWPGDDASGDGGPPEES